MRRPALRTLILLWLIGILFPMAFLGSLWPALGKVFNAVFAPGWMHLLMHAVLYAVLGFLLAIGIKPISAKHFLSLAGVIFLVGCLHKTLQLLAAGIWPGPLPELYDLLVDVSGAALGMGLWKFWPRRRVSM
ncbi:MAG: hypothetical protein AB1531_04930 [Chloroflexota bacterium]